MIQQKTENKSVRIIINLAVLLIFVILSLSITWPWIKHPFSTTIGYLDYSTQLESPDIMMNMSFGGWIHFALSELKQWPLSPSHYLMFPCGASHGTSFDSLLWATVVGGLNYWMPLTLAYNLSILLAFVMSGWICYLYSVHLWGRGWLAMAMGITAEFASHIAQRASCHPNLIYVWAIPLSMYGYTLFREQPHDWRQWSKWVATFPILALCSWYTFMAGMVFQSCAALSFFACNRRELLRKEKLTTQRLCLGWLLGWFFVLMVAWPMVKGSMGRSPNPLEFLAGTSTPLLQYFMPYPVSYLGLTQFVTHIQQQIGTNWEALACIPILCLLLLVVFVASHSYKENRLTLGLSAAAGIFLTLGPYAQFTHALAPGEGLNLPLFYLYHLSKAFGIVKCPGRLHILVFYVSLIASGHVLNSMRKYLSAKNHPFKVKAAWPLLITFFVLFNIAWTGRVGHGGSFPNPQVPGFYRDLGKKPGQGAILDVPIDYYATSIYDYYQFWHKRPCVSSVLYHDAVRPKSLAFIQSDSRMLFFIINNRFDNKKLLKSVIISDFMAYLAKCGIEYLVVHPKIINAYFNEHRMHPETLACYAQLDQAWKDRCIYRDDLIIVYRTGLSAEKKP